MCFTNIMATIMSKQRIVSRSFMFVRAFSTIETQPRILDRGKQGYISKGKSFAGKSMNDLQQPCMFRPDTIHHPYTTNSRLWSTKTSDETKREISLEALPEEMESSFLHGETDGIMKLSPSLMNSFSGEAIIISALEAAKNNKGKAASIINAVIASCSQDNMAVDGNDDAAALAWDIYCTWEELAEEIELFPDMVTFCATYSSVKRVTNTKDEDFFQDCAKQVLSRAQRYAKKLAGSKRRKTLNSISRRGGKNHQVNGMDNLEQMQKSYGQDFDILFEDDDVIVVNKPSGMVVFHSRKTTDGKIGRKKKVRTSKKKRNGKKQSSDDEELTDDHIAQYADISLEDAFIDIGLTLSTLNPDALGVVHRIDRGTSGCIVLAKNDDAHARLVTAFFTRSAKKRYTAIVPYNSSNSQETPTLELDSSGVIDLEVGGRPARSIYNVEREFGKAALQLDIETKTGRKHQVRVHCSKGLGRGIFLDPLYSDICEMAQTNVGGIEANIDSDDVKQIMQSLSVDSQGRQFFLHASKLSIKEFDIDVNSNVPSWWLQVLTDLKNLK